MPNFTEGEWSSGHGMLWANNAIIGEVYLNSPTAKSDARLMAQSKKMYENVLRKLDAWWRLPDAERTIENIEPIMRSTLDILSEIDKE
jgi:hypothetical protein